jgi:hypothetical protein
MNATNRLRNVDIGQLGAGEKKGLGLVARDAISLAIIGVGVGLAGALALTRLHESQLYGVAPIDAFVFGGAAE